MSHNLPLSIETEFFVSISLVLFVCSSLERRDSTVDFPIGPEVSQVITHLPVVVVPEVSDLSRRTLYIVPYNVPTFRR